MRQLSAAVQSTSRAATIEPLEDRVLFSRALGVDVSSYQGTINWTNVKAAGRSFAIVKATEGKTFNSSTFTAQITGAKNAGILVGAYHYARYDLNTAASEASHFLAVAGKYITAGYLHPVLDVEQSTSLTKTAVSNWVNAWCSQVKSATGVAPTVYTYVSYATAHLNSTVTQWPLWMAQYPSTPAPQTGAPSGTTPWTSWSFWQYTDHASVSGISGGVDGDVYNGDLTSLKAKFLIPSPTPKPSTPSGPSPADGANFRTSAPPTLLNWADAANASGYDVYLDGALKATVTTSQWTISGALAYGGHTWSVVAKNSAGTTAGPTWHFEIGKFLPGDRVVVTATSGLKAWDTSASNGTWIGKAKGAHATVVGGPVFAQGYWRWELRYDGDTVNRWSAEDWLVIG